MDYSVKFKRKAWGNCKFLHAIFERLYRYYFKFSFNNTAKRQVALIICS